MTDQQKAWEIEVTETIAAMRDIVPEGSNFEERLGRHRLEVKVSTLLYAAAIVQRAGEESIATFIRKEMLYDHPGDADMVAKKFSAFLKGER